MLSVSKITRLENSHEKIYNAFKFRRRGRVVDCNGFENRRTVIGTRGSNPLASAKNKRAKQTLALFCIQIMLSNSNKF